MIKLSVYNPRSLSRIERYIFKIQLLGQRHSQLRRRLDLKLRLKSAGSGLVQNFAGPIDRRKLGRNQLGALACFD